MKRITITRDNHGKVVFETVTVDATENVFFLNLDPQQEHFPDISSNKLGKAPSPPSSKCFPRPQYGCKFHGGEKGFINMPKPGKPQGKPQGKPRKPQGKPGLPQGKPRSSKRKPGL